MAHPGHTERRAVRLLAAAAVPVLGLSAFAWGYLGLLAHYGCAYNDSGRPCDPGPWIGRDLASAGGLAGAASLLVLACGAARVAAGHPAQRGMTLAVRAVAVCLAVCAAGILLLRSAAA